MSFASSARPTVFTYIEFWLSTWNMYLLQFEPRSASELPPVLMKRFFVRCATCAIARQDAEEISPTMQSTLSRSIMRSALVEAVCGLTKSSLISSILRPIHAAAGIDLFHCEIGGLHGIFAERSEEAGAGREMPDLQSVGLRIRNRRHADAGHECGAGRALEERTAVELQSRHWKSSRSGEIWPVSPVCLAKAAALMILPLAVICDHS